ncbi:hypothetical protein [Methylocapsa sp. S129]|uniref:hypothetical protein n=1 Tax=Methylocapsa sp. S129 TaxID=1641869 RepID=UPI00131A7CDF|nr:hypothetical protein [Methylocapsa sp. S129]
MSRSIWKSAVWFAFVGPPVGAAIAVGLLLASVAFREFFEQDHRISLMEMVPALLVDAAIIFAAAYPIGGPAAFGAGAAIEIMSKRAFGRASCIAASILIGAALSTLIVYGLDEYVLPHPHGDAAAGFGPHIWLSVGGVGALSAAICSYVFLRRA